MVAKFLKSFLKENNIFAEDNEGYIKLFLSDVEQAFLDSAQKILGNRTPIDYVEKFEV